MIQNPKNSKKDYIIENLGTKFDPDSKLPYIPTIYRYLFPNCIIPLLEGKRPQVDEFYGAGARSCGKTATAISFAILVGLLMPKKNIGVYIVRKQIQQRLESYNTLLNMLPTGYKFLKNKNEKTVIGPNFYCQVVALTAQSGKKIEFIGKFRANHDIQIVIFDEAFQFTEQDFSNIIASLGTGTKMIVFKISNPGSTNNDYFRTFSRRNAHFKKEKMRTVGSDKMLRGRTVFHGINALSIGNENLLSTTMKNFLLESPDRDKSLGDMFLYGDPVRLSGGIFSGSIVHAKKEDSIPEKLFHGATIHGGMDFGYTIDNTALILGAVSDEGDRVIILDEFVGDNSLKVYDVSVLCFEVMKFIRRNWQKGLGDGLITVYCDDDLTIVDSLNEAVARDETILFGKGKKRRLYDLVSFERVSDRAKKERLLDRITGISRALNNERFHYVHCPILLSEMASYSWQITPQGVGKKKPQDVDNHCIDALAYLLREYIGTIGRVT